MNRKTTKSDTSKSDALPMCGIIRPIAGMSDYPASHWRDVHDIIADAATISGYQARLVSESDAAGVILSEIITNIYNDPIVICDVSGKNPNVMFELGLRMAFEKPVIIVTDDVTDFSFDISPVKHIKYPKTLRFQDIIDFKTLLVSAIKATVSAASGPEYRGYLQQFGPIHVTQLETQNIAIDSLGQELVEIKRAVQALSTTTTRASRDNTPARHNPRRGELLYGFLVHLPAVEAKALEMSIDSIPGYVSELEIRDSGPSIVKIFEYDEKVEDKEQSAKRLAEIVERLRKLS